MICETGKSDWIGCASCRITTLHREENHDGELVWRCVDCGHVTTEYAR